ncbi:DNA repair protein RecN [Piscinibacter sakaiensis]|uniref:DNA repair protein RecN n=1 Tax=Piscinibacter sakaiensis TaxID=1547922 RepID=UPI003AAFF1C3
MLRRLGLRDFVIVSELEVEFDGGFSALTGETGAGKSILVDALQLALGSRGDAGVVREGASRADISAEFDTPASLQSWLDDAGFALGSPDDERLLLRRSIDAQGKSRAWINGGSATVAQLREAADHLVDIHGQHAWQSLTRAPAVRALLDGFAGVDAAPLAAAFAGWKSASDTLAEAQTGQAELQRERERLAWQIGEIDKLAPGAEEWAELDAEHRKLSNAQALIDAARDALAAISENEPAADQLTQRAIDALDSAAGIDAALVDVVEALRGAQAQLQDAAHSLSSYLHHTEPEPDRLQAIDERLSAWIALARRYRRAPEDLPALLAQWKAEAQALDAASDLDGLQQAAEKARAAFEAEAKRVGALRSKAAPKLSAAITQAMQQLGMAGGRFEVALVKQDKPQSFGHESAEFLVAGHQGSTPRPMAKVASGGELSRIALAVAVTTSAIKPGRSEQLAGTLIFDEIDAGVGGAIADTVGRLMKQLGSDRQVLAVTHLPQVAACADHHFVVAKQAADGRTVSQVSAVSGEARVAEIARMLAGERLSGTSLAHAEEMLTHGSRSIAAAVADEPVPAVAARSARRNP